MDADISPILDEWDYEPGKISVRRLTGHDGRERIQLRVDLGLLQMFAVGRPDGKRPHGRESLLEYFEDRLREHLEENDGDDEGFVLDDNDCARLLREAIQYHHRYLCLHQLKDYDGVLRDTDRNMKAFDLAEMYAATDELAWSLQQFRPQLLMMQTRAEASVELEKEDFDAAIQRIHQGLQEIRDFFEEEERLDLVEQSNELQSLQAWLEEVQGSQPLTRKQQIQKALDDAVAREDYETAARFRDLLQAMSEAGPGE